MLKFPRIHSSAKSRLLATRIGGSVLLLGGLTIGLIAVGGPEGLIYASRRYHHARTVAKAPEVTQSPVSLLAGIEWRMAGVTVIPGTPDNSLAVTNPTMAIVNQDGTANQSNPAVNLYGTYLQTSGDFTITVHIKDVFGKAGLTLYGTPPIVEDEFRAEVGTLDMIIDGSVFSATVSDSQKGKLAEIATGTANDATEHTIVIANYGGKLAFTVDGKALSRSVADNGIFATKNVWFGMDARTAGGSFTVDSLTAQGMGNTTVAVANSQTQEAVKDPNGLAAMAQKKRPGFLFGAAAALGPMVSDTQYKAALANYNSYTTENVGKFQFIHPLAGNTSSSYNFNDMDAMVAIAQKNGAVVHGHSLIFGEANPQWLQDLAQQNPSQINQTGIDHVTTIMSRYKGKVASWDVINEPLADYDTEEGQYGLRKNIWYNSIGPDYLTTMLKAAHAADPAAGLWINEFGLETDDDRFNTMVALVKRLQSQGAPLTGIGFQAHVDESDTINNGTGIDTAKLRKRIQTLAALGLKTRFSEVDISEDAQAGIPAQILSTCLSEASCVGMTTWGVTDKYSSGGGLSRRGVYEAGSGLLWDENVSPTQSLTAIKTILSL